MLQYFNFALVFTALFNVALFRCFTTILLLYYYFNIVLFNVTLNECYTFLFCSVNIALLMTQVVLPNTSSCANG